ncbi:MAG: NUDIX domain-containing protein [Clostridia bacterium]|nr:NUDIX domain-containing protein [Clostridia bacterium]
MFCPECGEKLTLCFCEDEGLVPYCNKCQSFRFPPFSCAVSMTVVNRAQDKILLAKHVDQDDFVLFAGYVKKGESAEKAIPREIKEELSINTVKVRYMASRYHDPRNVLMLGFIVMIENGDVSLNTKEIQEARWCTFDEAKELIRKNSTAEYFLNSAINELNKKP